MKFIRVIDSSEAPVDRRRLTEKDPTTSKIDCGNRLGEFNELKESMNPIVEE
jgi:hypothetical protein